MYKIGLKQKFKKFKNNYKVHIGPKLESEPE